LRLKDEHNIALALILMDIGLPKLDGIEAARRISELAPKSKILFVSQESPQMLCKPLSVQAHRATSSRWMQEANYRPP
jgi:DNA-binding NarL/FixJ family response regulator